MKMILPNEILLAEVSSLISEGHPVVIMTKGNSMLPFIRGEKDNVELVRPENPSVGDLALCQISQGHYVLHRIISLEGNDVVLKGDGNLKGTEHCTRADICGIVTKIMRSSGREVICNSPAFKRRSRLWAKMPYMVRRYTLAIYRRLI